MDAETHNAVIDKATDEDNELVENVDESDFMEDEFDDEEQLREKILRRGAPPRSWDYSQLQFFKSPLEQGAEIESLARGLTRQEVLSFYCLTEGLLPDYDEFFFDTHFMRGRIQGKQDAVKALFSSMKAKNGGSQAAVEYLSRFAEVFQESKQGSSKLPKSISMYLVE